jgi:Xaa-Pro aminopeptidase
MVATMPQPFRKPAVDFKSERLDALLITGPANVRYLSGYTGSNALVLATPDSGVLFTDPRYAIQASREVSCKVKVIPRGGLLPAAIRFLGRLRMKRVGFEKAHLSYEQHELIIEQGPGLTLVPIGTAIERQRMIKSDEEIAAIRRSVDTNSKAFDRAVKKIRPGVTEIDVAAEIEYQMRRLGAEKPAFETIVASGERTALPHAQPTSKKLGTVELTLIDMGATRDGYASDMTRMLHLGRPSQKIVHMYNAVLQAQLAGLDAVRAGVTAERVDRAARQSLKRQSLDRAFTHSTGHGLGLEIHEAPRLGRRDKTPLEAGMAITIEPGAYIEGFGGMRIEDTVLVTQNGCEILTRTPKELITL